MLVAELCLDAFTAKTFDKASDDDRIIPFKSSFSKSFTIHDEVHRGFDPRAIPTLIFLKLLDACPQHQIHGTSG